MSNMHYSDEFKLAVVKEYFEGNLGVRLLAKKYHLPSKNYITDWIYQLKRDGKIPKDATVFRNTGSSSKIINSSRQKNPYEKQLEKKVEKLEAEVAYLKKCKEIIQSNKKK